MTTLQNKWLNEANDAIDVIKNGIDTFVELKEKAVLSQNYKEAAILRDKQKAFEKKLLSLFIIKIK